MGIMALLYTQGSSATEIRWRLEQHQYRDDICQTHAASVSGGSYQVVAGWPAHHSESIKTSNHFITTHRKIVRVKVVYDVLIWLEDIF